MNIRDHHRFAVSARVARNVGAVAALALFLAGCRLFTTPGKDSLTLEVDAAPSTQVYLITSNNFAVGQDLEGQLFFQLFQADSGWIDVPFASEHSLRTTGMFYARLSEAEDPDAQVTMRVLVDGQQNWNETAVLQGTGLQYFFLQ